MTTNLAAFQQAQTAEAAYATFVDGAGNLITTDIGVETALRNSGFSASQATAFRESWEVINQIPDTSNSSFSATLFRSRQTNAYHLAIKGSLEASDFIQDANLIAANGVAVDQLVDLYNYWKALNTPAGTSYQAAYVGYGTTVQFGDSAAVRAGTPLASGLGKLLDCSSVTVSGHSLGGHLAMAFTRLFPGVSSQATAINGLGFKIGGMVVDQFFQALGGASEFDPVRIQNIYGIAGPEFAAMNGNFLYQPGGWDGIYIESARIGPPIFGGHGASQMTDSLAIYDLFFRMDAGLASKTPKDAVTLLNPLFKAASGKADTTLESLVRSWQRLMNITPGSLRTDDRQDLYVAVSAIRDSMAAFPQSTGRRVVSLVGRSANELAVIAANSDAVATRYALKALNPFAVIGIDYTAHSPTGELDLYDPVSGMGKLSTEWIRDRANMLATNLVSNTGDTGYAVIRDSHNWRYVDLDLGRTEFGFIPSSPAIDKAKAANGNVDFLNTAFNAEYGKGKAINVIFGRSTTGPNGEPIDDKGSKALIGGSFADHLYGQAGDDELKGGGGNDLLDGGAGDDILEGGEGFDIYIVGQGKDKIIDSDGRGIVLDGSGEVIAGQFVGQAGGTYTFVANSNITATQNSPLTITLPGGAQVVVENYDRSAVTLGIVTCPRL